jgi:hypothetical protein
MIGRLKIGAFSGGFLLFVLLARPAAGQATVDTRVEFVAQCSSGGQVCDPPFVVSLETASVLRAQYFVTRHCSSVRISFFVDGALRYVSGFLGWPGAPDAFAQLPLSTELLDFGPVPAGVHRLEVQAEGQVGGCNFGRLGSWGGALRTVVSSVQLVAIDIKPRDSTNTINLSSAGVIPVAVLSSPAFNATDIDPATVSLAGATVRLIGRGSKYSCAPDDVNDDGLPDLVCHVETAAFMIEPGDSVAVLDARTLNGLSVRGRDSVRIVPE